MLHQTISLRVNLEPQTHCLSDAYLLVQNTLVIYTCACAPSLVRVGRSRFRIRTSSVIAIEFLAKHV
eukprot:3785434-Heterocapsa_arctica.AAC.1